MVVDRYAAYNKVPCAIQYCYAHLLREVQDLEKEFPDSLEVKAFVNTLAPLLSLAMGLRNQDISDTEFRSKAATLKTQILHTVHCPATHLGIQRLQGIFREHAERKYHWADSRQVPADNNLAERDLRPTVIARKTSFGSQSDAGAHTRGVLMSVLYSIRKRGVDVTAHLRVSSMNSPRISTKTPLLCCSPEIAQRPKIRPSLHVFPRSNRGSASAWAAQNS